MKLSQGHQGGKSNTFVLKGKLVDAFVKKPLKSTLMSTNEETEQFNRVISSSQHQFEKLIHPDKIKPQHHNIIDIREKNTNTPIMLSRTPKKYEADIDLNLRPSFSQLLQIHTNSQDVENFQSFNEIDQQEYKGANTVPLTRPKSVPLNFIQFNKEAKPVFTNPNLQRGVPTKIKEEHFFHLPRIKPSSSTSSLKLQTPQPYVSPFEASPVVPETKQLSPNKQLENMINTLAAYSLLTQADWESGGGLGVRRKRKKTKNSRNPSLNQIEGRNNKIIALLAILGNKEFKDPETLEDFFKQDLTEKGTEKVRLIPEDEWGLHIDNYF